MIGATVGNYRILEKLGEGGMGTVFKGLDLTLEREVAIKMLRHDLTEQPQLVERFRAEAIVLARLNHPHIAMLFNFFRLENTFFMVLEYVRGRPLNAVMSQSGALPYAWALTLVDQMLDGLTHAHELNIIHRDLKPANLMLTELGAIKITDFGIARMLGTTRMTRTGGLVGTLEYMSPERVRGKEADARSDLYSVGIVLYELLTGHVPFHRESDYELMRAQVEEPPLPPRAWLPDIPPEIERLILRALAKAPEDRFQSAREMRAALRAAESGPLPASADLPPPERPVPDTPTQLVAPPSLETNRLVLPPAAPSMEVRPVTPHREIAQPDWETPTAAPTLIELPMPQVDPRLTMPLRPVEVPAEPPPPYDEAEPPPPPEDEAVEPQPATAPIAASGGRYWLVAGLAFVLLVLFVVWWTLLRPGAESRQAGVPAPTASPVEASSPATANPTPTPPAEQTAQQPTPAAPNKTAPATNKNKPGKDAAARERERRQQEILKALQQKENE